MENRPSRRTSDHLLNRQICAGASTYQAELQWDLFHPAYNLPMPLTCNIDAKGKFVRLIYGVVLLLVGVALMIWWAWGTGSMLRWGVACACAGMGAFAIFEARAGWCIVRAMGIKTRM
jgi:hypothetical protein